MTEVQKDSAIFAPITLKFKVWDRLKIYVFFDGLCKEEKKKIGLRIQNQMFASLALKEVLNSNPYQGCKEQRDEFRVLGCVIWETQIQ